MCFENGVIIAILTNKSKYFATKSEKILQYRKKHSAIRHEYYTMANKYSHYDKYMLSFTVPSTVRGRTIKNGRYTKLRELLKIRAYIGKLLNNSDDVKYFMNIELGKKYSNPHIHVQLWIKPKSNNTSARTAKQILTKAIDKFNLNKNRCYLTTQENKNIDVYHYVIKDYAKDLSDNDLWNLETQKKRMRKQLGKKVRFISKSRDKYTKRIYRIMYYSYGVVRDLVDYSIDFFIRNFFYFSKKRGLKIVSFCSWFSNLGYIEQEGKVYFCGLIFDVLHSCRDPPFCWCREYGFADIKKTLYASKKFI